MFSVVPVLRLTGRSGKGLSYDALEQAVDSPLPLPPPSLGLAGRNIPPPLEKPTQMEAQPRPSSEAPDGGIGDRNVCNVDGKLLFCQIFRPTVSKLSCVSQRNRL